MQETIRFLVKHPEVIGKLQNGTVSLVGLSDLKVKAIVKTWNKSVKPLQYWL